MWQRLHYMHGRPKVKKTKMLWPARRTAVSYGWRLDILLTHKLALLFIYIYSIEVVAVSVDKPAGGSAECVSSSGPASLNGQTSNCHVRWDCRTEHQWKCSGFFFSF
jgi:hypothetical protein